ncbi:hypothetical protein TCAL_01952 [Tigriopus californicus]|uniref:Uncharacterized protein n=1 Tax=Tigriopus californicus TaxID=6832 RepID=A0A553P674_TIGCA|nr:cytoplasmic dynein 2 intermediate chain 2-like [Tigriopus californicus]TRY73188.1 hypothetical protein TCAL_01952 [Tigriopus californicus]|eukprot:TCALIF_01952-PA protein Name:"Similar to Wdr34 WD repeat-containing protein 34 (Mus musculus)" AED:0.03 eAED:0.03 QI:0/-1/0/1/-1/1/1/0/511
MFSDRNAMNIVEFPSCWKKSRSVKDSECQSEAQKMVIVETQVTLREDAESQTEEQAKETKVNEDQINLPSLVKFLVKVTPIMEEELAAAARSRAFDGYELATEKTDSEMRKLHVLVNGNQEDIRVSGLTWGPSGSVMAVSYEMETHMDWCDHLTQLCIWNINRRDFDPNKPYKIIPASSCLTVVQFHPRDPAYVAAGGFTGEIYLWSVSREQDPLVANSSSMSGHREKITSLHWINATTTAEGSLRHTQLLSAALDGKMILWNIDMNTQALTPSKRFWIPAEHIPRSLNAKIRARTELGITCLDLNKEDENIILLGTEAGAVFQGSLAAILPVQGPDKESDEGPEYLDPVSVSFQPHRGRILEVRCSPFARDLFFSLGSDREIRLWSLLQPHAPVAILHSEATIPLRAQWSPFRPAVLALTSSQGQLFLYDLRQSVSRAALSVKSSERSVALPSLSSLAFNAWTPGWIGAGDAHGGTHVWKLPAPWSGTDQQTRDRLWITNLLTRLEDEEQ